MKKSLFLTLAACFVALGMFSAFADGMTAEQKEEQQKIADLLTEKLDMFRAEKEQECSDRAMEAAIVQADEMIAAAAAGKKSVTRKPVRKKPTYTTKGSETTTTTTAPPPPAPKTKVEEAADNVRDKMKKATEAPSTTKTTTAPVLTEEKKEEVRSKVRDKMKKAKGGN